MLVLSTPEGKLNLRDILETFLLFGLLESRLEAVEGHLRQGHPGFGIELY